MLAYFDPGSGSMLMQLLVGGAAGIFVFGRYLWQSFADAARGRIMSDRTRSENDHAPAVPQLGEVR